MKGLPIPSSLSGWICAVVLLFFLFVGYYLYLFPALHVFYFEEEAGFPALYSGTKDRCDPLEIRVDSPRQIAPFGKRWVYITIRNDSASPITVTASLSVTPSLTGWYMPFLFGGSTSDTTAVSFSPLQPHATAYGRIPLFSTEKITEAALYIHIPEGRDCTVTIAQRPIKNPWRYLAHAFSEQLLLPPWSNWILAAIGLLIPALVEPKEWKEPKEPTELSLQSLGQMFGRSLGLSLAFIAGVLVAMSAIWWPVESGWWNIVIIIVSLIVIILFVWRSLGLGWPQQLSQWLQGRKSLQDLSKRLQEQKWMQSIRDPLRQKWSGSLIVPVILLLVGIALWLLSKQLLLFPLVRPLGGIFIVMGVPELLSTILRTMYSQESGGGNESGSDRGSPADAPGDKSES